MRVDESAVLNYMIDNATGIFTSTGELLAAAESLWHRGFEALLRLGAEATPH